MGLCCSCRPKVAVLMVGLVRRPIPHQNTERAPEKIYSSDFLHLHTESPLSQWHSPPRAGLSPDNSRVLSEVFDEWMFFSGPQKWRREGRIAKYHSRWKQQKNTHLPHQILIHPNWGYFRWRPPTGLDSPLGGLVIVVLAEGRRRRKTEQEEPIIIEQKQINKSIFAAAVVVVLLSCCCRSGGEWVQCGALAGEGIKAAQSSASYVYASPPPLSHFIHISALNIVIVVESMLIPYCANRQIHWFQSIWCVAKVGFAFNLGVISMIDPFTEIINCFKVV